MEVFASFVETKPQDCCSSYFKLAASHRAHDVQALEGADRISEKDEECGSALVAKASCHDAETLARGMCREAEACRCCARRSEQFGEETAQTKVQNVV